MLLAHRLGGSKSVLCILWNWFIRIERYIKYVRWVLLRWRLLLNVLILSGYWKMSWRLIWGFNLCTRISWMSGIYMLIIVLATHQLFIPFVLCIWVSEITFSPTWNPLSFWRRISSKGSHRLTQRIVFQPNRPSYKFLHIAR